MSRKAFRNMVLAGIFLIFSNAMAEQLTVIKIDPTKSLGKVNPLIFGNNIEAGNSNGIFSNKDSEHPLNGGGTWIPELNKPIPEVVAIAKEIRMGMLRYPGGCLTHNFDWHKAVGAKKDRTYYKFGIDEYIELCRAIGAEPLMNVSEICTAKDAADLVEYLNMPAMPEYPWAMKRAEWGHQEPYHGPWIFRHGGHIQIFDQIGGVFCSTDFADIHQRFRAYGPAKFDIFVNTKFVVGAVFFCPDCFMPVEVMGQTAAGITQHAHTDFLGDRNDFRYRLIQLWNPGATTIERMFTVFVAEYPIGISGFDVVAKNQRVYFSQALGRIYFYDGQLFSHGIAEYQENPGQYHITKCFSTHFSPLVQLIIIKNLISVAVNCLFDGYSAFIFRKPQVNVSHGSRAVGNDVLIEHTSDMSVIIPDIHIPV
eukprot:TRINITY_DN2511_c0_g1_i1.p4 TRINITY_DN2511_c0_g1~~TRINITY_DN2511_c0_g1_i1.p4  ORF type:complete len:423 (-),score=51.24 TRINITY_DN2511_c0_g1_i1:2016-3284(-)